MHSKRLEQSLVIRSARRRPKKRSEHVIASSGKPQQSNQAAQHATLVIFMGGIYLSLSLYRYRRTTIVGVQGISPDASKPGPKSPIEPAVTQGPARAIPDEPQQ